ncbi:MAG: hypothetical protein MSH10_04860 [Pygmaiobacter massiliensis]|nr:hypothetical protein [Pygmaiobacter massiliensis]
MAPLVAPWLRAIDLVSAAGVGVGLAILYTALRFAAGKGKIRLFFCDFFTLVFAAIVLMSYALSFSYTGQLRWYMTAAAGAGAAGWLYVARGVQDRILQAVFFWLQLPVRLFIRLILLPVRLLRNILVKKVEKMRAKAQKNRARALRRKQKVLYNFK